MKTVPLGDAMELAYGKSLPVRSRIDGDYPVYGANGPVGTHNEAIVDGPAVIVGRKGSAGAVQLVRKPCFPIDTTYFVRARDGVDLDLEYSYFALKHLDLSRIKTSTGVPGLTREDAYKQPFPLPPLDEQRRIVDVLNRAASIERLRAQATNHLRDLIPALFIKMFGGIDEIAARFEVSPLKEIANIGSGITKGRKIPEEQQTSVPYLRVANVQDGYLDLSEIKEIVIRKGEEEKYAVQRGDLLMTEGGDPDKLGRGAIWEGQLPYCAHQNHVFRVRPDTEQVLSYYLRGVVGSEYGKAYFLRVAKQTTGIASINKTQLGNFPVPVPPMELQEKFVSVVQRINESSTLLDPVDQEVGGPTFAELSAGLMDQFFGSRV